MRSCVRSSRALSPALLPRLLPPQSGFRLAARGFWASPRCLASAGDSQPLPLPSQARVVICGGGVVGTSVAYHLARLGWSDIVLLEQGRSDGDEAAQMASGSPEPSLFLVRGGQTVLLCINK